MSNESVIHVLEKAVASIEQLHTAQREQADRLTGVEQRAAMRGDMSHISAINSSLGDQFFKAFEPNREMFLKGGSLRLEIKAASDPVTTTSGRKLLGVGVGVPGGGVLGLQNAFTARPANGTTVAEYSRYTGQQGAAGVQAAEGDSKPAVRPDHTLIQQSAITIAGHAKMSRQALNDSDELRRAIEVTLNRSVAIQLDVGLVDGVVAPVFSGFGPLATASTSAVYDTLPDAVSEGVAAMQVDGFAPDVVGLNPADWLAITVARGVANDHYLSGSYLGPLPVSMRGLRVVLSPTVEAGKALLMDTSHSELLMVDGFTIELAYSGDDFVKNLITVLGEVRVIPIFRTVGSARLITPAA